MRIAFALACVAALAPGPASAQPVEPESRVALPTVEPDSSDPNPDRPLGQRYLEALTGALAVTGIAVAGVSVLTAVGVGASYAAESDVGLYTTAYGAAALGSLAFIVGPAIGTRYWSGLSAGEGFLISLLGALVDVATFGVSVGIGIAFIASDVVPEVDAAYAMYSVGAGAGVLTGLFLEPLFGAAIFGDRHSEEPGDIRVAPVLAAAQRGGVIGLSGAF